MLFLSNIREKSESHFRGLTWDKESSMSTARSVSRLSHIHTHTQADEGKDQETRNKYLSKNKRKNKTPGIPIKEREKAGTGEDASHRV